MVLNPLNIDLLTAQILSSLECIPTVDVGVAIARSVAVIARRIRAHTLIYAPQMVLDPHTVVPHENGSSGVRENRKGALVVDSVFNTRSFTFDVIVLDRGIFASVAERWDRIILREEAQAERICLPTNQSVGVTALLAILAAHSELFWIEGRGHGGLIHIFSLCHNFTGGEVNVRVLVTPSSATDALAELAARHSILIASAFAVPAMRIAVIWARGLLQAIWNTGTRDAGVMVLLRGVAPVA